MSNPPVIKYPLDLTGLASSNLVSGEIHTVSVGSQPAFVTNYGPFYTAGLVLTRLDTGQVLIPKTINSTGGQYVATQILTDMTLRTGLDICSVLVLTDTTLPPNLQVSVSYQVLGGPFSASVDAIQQLIDALDLGGQPVLWADILGKPVLFPPAPHLHDLGDIYGFEYLVAVLERIVQAIYIGDDAQLTAIYAYIDNQIAGLQSSIAANSAALTAHITDFNNPHRTTAAEVGLGNVQNFPIASTADAQAGVSNVEYMTPALTAAAITAQIGNAFEAHITNFNNPHQVTAAQIGLGNVSNFPMATTAQAQAGTNNASLMSPFLTAAAITTQALTPLNAHVNNLNNPHATTQAQVGLGSVSNFGTATNAQGVTGTSAALFMTPASTTAAIAGQVGNAFAAHVANVANPHATTAAQVGLGNCNNTSDLNKPISTATQTALNAKASQNTAVNFTSIGIGSTNPFIFESSTGALAIRSGTTGAFFFSIFGANGNLAINGQVQAPSFQSSDKTLKKNIRNSAARPLWRDADGYKSWDWKNAKAKDEKHGWIAQDVLTFAPEYVSSFEDPTGKTYLGINKAALGFEMAIAAGDEVDRLNLIVADLSSRLKSLETKASRSSKGG